VRAGRKRPLMHPARNAQASDDDGDAS